MLNTCNAVGYLVNIYGFGVWFLSVFGLVFGLLQLLEVGTFDFFSLPLNLGMLRSK